MTTDLDHLSASARNASLQELVTLLERQQAAKHDVVVAASALRCERGMLRATNTHQRFDLDGVTRRDALLAPTRLAEAGMADRFRIPTDYLRRMRAEHLDLYDANVNGWLGHQPERRFLVRGLVDHSGAGVLRALLSDAFRIVDHLDVLMTVLDGVSEAGAAVDVAQADLTEARMYLKIRSREIATMAPQLLRNYTSPFTRARGAENPLVFAGFVVSNSETGHGAFTISPQITVQICDNGMTLTKHAHREVHLGGKLPAGAIRWNQDTHDASLALVRKCTRDAVATFLSEDFLSRRIAELEQDASTPVRDPQPLIEHVGARLRFSETARAAILNRFIEGGDMTSGGMMHAVTAAAQDMADADESHALEAAGVEAMQRAAAFVRAGT
ncbi:DUF932 domain-containing protein [Pseudonocardia sp. C8]|uniref:DUF932 domain-containing protein n=1 Tax=Pseudonocardia sp. C8 TaxID=2762759 RepID=UPI001642A292|nr:DUF932 domain-containing protein [Pseudonocardia sp. C8]MBC3191676.1 DUF932 domain-containing protein [Pseudonocardia sp. C8]